MQINRPIPFAGNDEERAANRDTHRFGAWGDDNRCIFCDCKPWHQTANYPCGFNVPREDVEIPDNTDPILVGHVKAIKDAH